MKIYKIAFRLNNNLYYMACGSGGFTYITQFEHVAEYFIYLEDAIDCYKIYCHDKKKQYDLSSIIIIKEETKIYDNIHGSSSKSIY